MKLEKIKWMKTDLHSRLPGWTASAAQPHFNKKGIHQKSYSLNKRGIFVGLNWFKFFFFMRSTGQCQVVILHFCQWWLQQVKTKDWHHFWNFKFVPENATPCTGILSTVKPVFAHRMHNCTYFLASGLCWLYAYLSVRWANYYMCALCKSVQHQMES